MDNRRQIDTNLTEHQLYEELRLLEIETNIKGLETKIDKLSRDVSGLVSAWEATSWLVGAVKWLSGIAMACAALFTLFKR
jgi:hypothetical protein